MRAVQAGSCFSAHRSLESEIFFLGVYDRSAPEPVYRLSETDFRGTPGSALAHVQVEPATAERLYRQIHAALRKRPVKVVLFG
jgi:hypothetical protein